MVKYWWANISIGLCTVQKSYTAFNNKNIKNKKYAVLSILFPRRREFWPYMFFCFRIFMFNLV